MEHEPTDTELKDLYERNPEAAARRDQMTEIVRILKEIRPPELENYITAESIDYLNAARSLATLLDGQGGKPSWFTQRLFDLLMNADSGNFAKLQSVYPLECDVLLRFRKNGMGWLCRIAGVEQRP